MSSNVQPTAPNLDISSTPVENTEVSAQDPPSTLAEAPNKASVPSVLVPRPGDTVVLVGLAKKPELNGARGTVMPLGKWTGERVGVRCADASAS